MSLILVRHGESEGNASGIVQGRLDFGLTDLGHRQARTTAAHLAGKTVGRLLSSPLRRAAETAETVAASLGVAVEFDPRLEEYDMGEISGLTGAQIRERYPHVLEAFSRGERPRFPGEEGRAVFFARVRAVLDAVAESRDTVVLVAHGGVIGAMCYAALGMPYDRPGAFHVANCSLTEFVRDRAGRLVLRRHNDTCHLDGATSD